MRILIVSYFFPPFNSIGAVRVGKLAKYLHEFGHDVRVLSAQEQPLQPTLQCEIPPASVVYTPWWNVNWLPEKAVGGREKVASQGFVVEGGKGRWLGRLGVLYKTLLNFPDPQVGWGLPALRAGAELLQEWTPDVILASSGPPTALLVASRLSRRFGVPWVADLRDLWADSHGYGYPAWRRPVEDWLERRILGTASGMVTVSEPLRETLASKYDAPTAVVHNGYDPADYPDDCGPTADPMLRIVYTGMIYRGAHDFDPLFRAIRMLGDRAERLRVDFYGKYVEYAREPAEAHGVGHLVATHGMVDYRQSLRLQREADALLFLLSRGAAFKGVYGGKLFEYLGAYRPVIAVAHPESSAGELIRGLGVGVASTDPEVLAEQLSEWLAIKLAGGILPDLDRPEIREFTRERQSRVLEEFLSDVARVHQRKWEARRAG